jgi:murein tripeptide amidase MpaA
VSNTSFLSDFFHHGDGNFSEKAGPMTLLYLIRELVENWQANLDVLTDVDWVIVPLLNPDGLSYFQNVHQFWAKSRAVIPGSTCRGVHLNRNYDSNWLEKGSSNDVSRKH